MEAIKKEMRLSKPENFADGDRIPEIVIYSEENFSGIEYRTNCNVDLVGKLMNDNVNSIIVVSGTWEVFEHKDYNGKLLGTLIPGYYPTYNQIDSISDKNKISSIKCITF
jgi:hypothetical protein